MNIHSGATAPHFFWGGCGRAMVLGNFQCQGILLIWLIVGQGATVLAVGPSCLDIFPPPLGRQLDID